MITKLAENFAREKHNEQFRKFEGEPYFNHVKKVAKIIKENKKSDSLIVHDKEKKKCQG